MARKKKPEEHANHERWLVSYADFMTLLFAFFTSMYAISSLDLQKAGRLVTAMQSAFNYPVMQAGSSSLPLSEGAGHKSTNIVSPVSAQMGRSIRAGAPTPPPGAGQSGGFGTVGSGKGGSGKGGSGKDGGSGAGGDGSGSGMSLIEVAREQLERMLEREGLSDMVDLHAWNHELWITMSGVPIAAA